MKIAYRGKKKSATAAGVWWQVEGERDKRPLMPHAYTHNTPFHALDFVLQFSFLSRHDLQTLLFHQLQGELGLYSRSH
jgi:hypothetical protein